MATGAAPLVTWLSPHERAIHDIKQGLSQIANWDYVDARKKSLDHVDPDARSLDHIFVGLSITGSEKYERTPFVTENVIRFICIGFLLMKNFIAQTKYIRV